MTSMLSCRTGSCLCSDIFRHLMVQLNVVIFDRDVIAICRLLIRERLAYEIV